MFPEELGVYQLGSVSLGGKQNGSSSCLVGKAGQEKHIPFQEVYPAPHEAAWGLAVVSDWYAVI